MAGSWTREKDSSGSHAWSQGSTDQKEKQWSGLGCPRSEDSKKPEKKIRLCRVPGIKRPRDPGPVGGRLGADAGGSQKWVRRQDQTQSGPEDALSALRIESRTLSGSQGPDWLRDGERRVPRARAERRDSAGRESCRKVGSGAAGKGALPEAGRVGAREGRTARWLFFFPLQSLSRRRLPKRKSRERWLSRPINAGLGDVTGRSLTEGSGAEGEGGTRNRELWGYLSGGLGVVGRRVDGSALPLHARSGKLTFRCRPPPRARDRGRRWVFGGGSCQAGCIRLPPQGKGRKSLSSPVVFGLSLL